MPYILTFCRIVTGFVFVASFWGKVQNINQFVQTITNFKLLHSRYSRPLALLFLLGETTVVALLFVGKQLLPAAFGLAALLLVAFSVALISILVRNIQTSCNCFGSDPNPVTYADVGRNVGLILIVVFGIVASKLVGQTGGQLTAVDSLLMAIAAAIFLIIWLNLRDVLQLFQPVRTVEGEK